MTSSTRSETIKVDDLDHASCVRQSQASAHPGSHCRSVPHASTPVFASTDSPSAPFISKSCTTSSSFTTPPLGFAPDPLRNHNRMNDRDRERNSVLVFRLQIRIAWQAPTTRKTLVSKLFINRSISIQLQKFPGASLNPTREAELSRKQVSGNRTNGEGRIDNTRTSLKADAVCRV